LQFADLRFADPNLLQTYNFRKSKILYFSADKFIPEMFELKFLSNKKILPNKPAADF
jgi:hypothetical protein